MPHQSGVRPAALCAVAIGTCLGTSLFAAPAFAATGSPDAACRATVAELSILGSAPLVVSDNHQATCADADGAVNINALGLAQVGAASTATRVESGKSAGAAAEIANVNLGASSVAGQITPKLLSGSGSLLPGLVSSLEGQLNSGGLSSVLQPLSALGLRLDGVDDAGLLSQLSATLPGVLDGALPELVSADVIRATATARCENGAAVLGSDVDLVGAEVLGTAISSTDAKGRIIGIDSANLTFSTALTARTLLRSIKVHAQAGSLLGLLIGSQEMTLEQLLELQGGLLGSVNGLLGNGLSLGTILGDTVDGLTGYLAQQPLNLPADFLQATVTVGNESGDATSRTASAVQLKVTALGQPVLEGTLARATVQAPAVNCAGTQPPVVPPVVPPTNPPGGNPGGSGSNGSGNGNGLTGPQSPFVAAALQCTGERVKLIDVRRSGNKQFLSGVAAQEYVGQKVNLYLGSIRRKVGTVVVPSSGVFSAHVARPPLGLRGTNKARYFARLDQGAKTKSLKAERFVNASTLASPSAGIVTFSGQVQSKSRRKVTVTIQERTSCTSYKRVAKVKTDANGRFTVRFASKADNTAVFRAQTMIRKSPKAKRVFPTYSLPRLVNVK